MHITGVLNLSSILTKLIESSKLLFSLLIKCEYEILKC